MPRGYYASRDTLFNRCAACLSTERSHCENVSSLGPNALRAATAAQTLVPCCDDSELRGAYAYGLAGTMVWEIWPVFGNDGGYECASALHCCCSAKLPIHHP